MGIYYINTFNRTGRKILFKGKKLSDGTWAEGDLLHKDGKTYIYGSYIDESGVYIEDMPVDPSTVCQYTGLKDDFGKPIYENDIVDFGGEGEILFRDGAFYAKFTKYMECLLSTLTDAKPPLKAICSKFDRKEGEK